MRSDKPKFINVILCLILYLIIMYNNIITIIDYSKTLPSSLLEWDFLQYRIFFSILVLSYIVTRLIIKYIQYYYKCKRKRR